jgi:hypothetical protein
MWYNTHTHTHTKSHKATNRIKFIYDIDVGIIRKFLSTMNNMSKSPIKELGNTHCQMSVFSRDENCIFIKANEDTFNCRINTKG